MKPRLPFHDLAGELPGRGRRGHSPAAACLLDADVGGTHTGGAGLRGASSTVFAAWWVDQRAQISLGLRRPRSWTSDQAPRLAQAILRIQPHWQMPP
jgi:hypothetical protein